MPNEQARSYGADDHSCHGQTDVSVPVQFTPAWHVCRHNQNDQGDASDRGPKATVKASTRAEAAIMTTSPRLVAVPLTQGWRVQRWVEWHSWCPNGGTRVAPFQTSRGTGLQSIGKERRSSQGQPG